MANTRARARIIISELAPDTTLDGHELRDGLSQTPKTIPSAYFYDERGSRLFEELCRQPEYYQTRLESQILAQSGHLPITRRTCRVIDLGSGNAQKIPIVLSHLSSAGHDVTYMPIDVDRSVLERACHHIAELFPDVQISGWAGTFQSAVPRLASDEDTTTVYLMLGGAIGNLQDAEVHAFAQLIRDNCRPGDLLVVGADLEKDTNVLESAYNDANGVAVASNLNVLKHVNWRHEADFPVDSFRHVARWVVEHKRVEAYLQSIGSHAITIRQPLLQFHVRDGEMIRTEIMRKWLITDLEKLVSSNDFELQNVWTDPHRWYAVCVFRAVDI